MPATPTGPAAWGADDLEKFEEFERRGWARRSGTYDRGFARITAGAHAALLDAAQVGASSDVVEAGCGTGRLTAAALARGARVVATDAVPEMVELTRAALPKVRVEQAILPGLPFDDHTFDAAVGAFVINHVAEPGAAVADLARVVRPGGRLALSCWGSPRGNRAQSIVTDALAEAEAERPDDLPEAPPFAAHSSPQAFAALLRGAGLRQVRVTELSWTHRVDPDQWWQDLLTGTVFTASLLERQDEAATARIKRAYDRLVRRYAAGDGLVELPVEALIASGERA